MSTDRTSPVRTLIFAFSLQWVSCDAKNIAFKPGDHAEGLMAQKVPLNERDGANNTREKSMILL